MGRSMNFNQRLCDFAMQTVGQTYRRPETVCMALAFRGLDAAAGTQFYARHQQHFKSASAMRSFLGDAGLDGLIGYLVSIGFAEIDPIYIQPGDIGFTGQPPFGVGAVLIVGRQVLTSHPDTGVVTYPISNVQLCRAVRYDRHGAQSCQL